MIIQIVVIAFSVTICMRCLMSFSLIHSLRGLNVPLFVISKIFMTEDASKQYVLVLWVRSGKVSNSA